MNDYQKLKLQVIAELDVNPNITDARLYMFILNELVGGRKTVADNFFVSLGYTYSELKTIKSRLKKYNKYDLKRNLLEQDRTNIVG